MSNVADVVIIGGGVNGCAAAYYLAKSGVKNVAVLEASKSIGHGGSSRNGGGVRQSGRDVRELPYAMYGIQNMWPTLSEELGVDTEYTQKGNLRMGKTPAHLKKLEMLANNAKSVGLDVRMIDQKEVKEICPYLSDEVIGASWCPTDGHANPLTTTLGYYKRALDMGVRFYTDAPVKELKKVKGKVRKVILNDGTVFEGETVILVAGYESRAIARTIGVDVPMTRLIDECFVTEMQPHMIDVMFGCADVDFYGHQTKHGSFVFGGSSGLEGFTKDNGTPICYAKTAPCICRGIMKYFPDLADAKIVRTWAGWMDKCVDGVPVLGKVEEVPGLVLACGFTGHGFGIAPGAADQIAELITTGTTTVDLSDLRYDRFRAKI